MKPKGRSGRMPPPRLALAAATILLLAAGCARTTSKDLNLSESTDEGKLSIPPATAEPEPERDKPVRPGHPDWAGLGNDSPLPRESGIAFDAFGHRVSTLEYQLAFKQFLSGREATGELEREFRDRLRERLMMLTWLERADLRQDAGFRAELRGRMRRELADAAIDRILRNEQVPVTDAEVRRLYDSRIDQFRSPEMARIRLIQVSTEGEARAVIARLDAGEDFGAVAREVSRHASSSRGGEIDPFPRGTLGSRELEDLAFRLQTGGVDTLSSSTGYFVVKKIGAIPQQAKPFADVAPSLRRELEDARKSEARTRLIGRIEQEITWGP